MNDIQTFEFASNFMSMDELSIAMMHSAVWRFMKIAMGYGIIFFFIDFVANLAQNSVTSKIVDWPRFSQNAVVWVMIPLYTTLLWPVNKVFEGLYMDISQPIEVSVGGMNFSSDTSPNLQKLNEFMGEVQRVAQARQDSLYAAGNNDIIPSFEAIKNGMISGAQSVMLGTTKTLTAIIGPIIDMYNTALFRIMYLAGPFALMFSMFFRQAWIGWFKFYVVIMFVMAFMEIIYMVINVSLVGNALNQYLQVADTQTGWGIMIGAAFMYVILFLFVYFLTGKVVGGGGEAGRPTQMLGSMAMMAVSFGLAKGGLSGLAGKVKSEAVPLGDFKQKEMVDKFVAAMQQSQKR